MSEKSVFVLDDRPATHIPLLPELESQEISYTVIGNLFQAIRRIPDINDDGMIIKGFLD
jgi:hypothetical protein